MNIAMILNPGSKLAWASFRIATYVAILLVTINASCPQEKQSKIWSRYYPLAKGNQWKYAMTGGKEKAQSKYVLWKVINSSANAAGMVFSVWPTPANTDDSGMQLQVTAEGLRELSSDFFLLKFPLQHGNTWTTSNDHRTFTVLSEGKNCSVGKLKFDLCAMVQDDDREAKLRTITTYALGVGPVRYEYYNLVGEQFETQASYTLNLISYSFNSSAGRSRIQSEFPINE